MGDAVPCPARLCLSGTAFLERKTTARHCRTQSSPLSAAVPLIDSMAHVRVYNGCHTSDVEVPESHRTERIGVSIVSTKVHQDLGWVFRETPSSDFGVDAEIEVDVNQRATGRLLGVQIKSGPSQFREAEGDAWIYRLKDKHVSYWLHHSLPIVLLLVDIDQHRVYWQHIALKALTRTGIGWKTLIPKANVLDHTAVSVLLELIRSESPPTCPMADERTNSSKRWAVGRSTTSALDDARGFPAGWSPSEVEKAMYAVACRPDYLQHLPKGDWIANGRYRGVDIVVEGVANGQITSGRASTTPR